MIRNFVIVEPDLLGYRGKDVELAFMLSDFWPEVNWTAYMADPKLVFGHLYVSTTDPKRMDVIRLTHVEDEEDNWGTVSAIYRTNHPTALPPKLCHEQLRRLFGRVPHRLYAWRVK